MKQARIVSLSLVSLFVFSLFSAIDYGSEIDNSEIELEDTPLVQNPSQATSPGHVVFGQYISSDNCGHCSKTGGGSDAHHSIKQNHPDEYVYVTYMSASYGDTDTTRAGNVAPYNWAWSTSGAPDAYFGDRTDKGQSGANAQYTTYDSLYSSGGGMHSTVNDYTMKATISQSAGKYDIGISYKYKGSGTPASNMKLYAALVDKDCTGYSYTSGIPHGYNCWMAWLTDNDTYKSKNGGTGTAFKSVTVTSTEKTESWTNVPTSVVPGGLNKAIVVGVLMSGNQVSVGGNSPHVYHAIDSTMGPMIDVGITDVAITSQSGHDGYINGDSLDVDVELTNLGDEVYSDGGSLKVYTFIDNVETEIGTANINSLGVGSTQSESFAVDTTNFPSGIWSATIRAKLFSVNGDRVMANNLVQEQVMHDMSPSAREPRVIGSTEIDRDMQFFVEAKALSNDGVDSISSTTFELEYSLTGQGDWSGTVVSRGEEVLSEGTTNERREYLISPDNSMAAGVYDLRLKAIDSRGQESDWTSNEEAFRLMNAKPEITADPIPTVKRGIETRIDMTNHVDDPETLLSDLVITSSDSEFLGWYAADEQIAVQFDEISYSGGEPVQSSIEIIVNDGEGDTYGTLLFNVIENGQPRWSPIPVMNVDEDQSATLTLSTLISDTDDDGNPSPAEDLILAITSNSNEELISAEIIDFVLYVETVHPDLIGESTLTLRASDGIQFSETTVRVLVNNVNDAPRLDETGLDEIKIKKGTTESIDLLSRVNDVDGELSYVDVQVSTLEQSALDYNPGNGMLEMNWDKVGEHVVTIRLADRYDSNTYTMKVEVYDSLPLTVSSNFNDDSMMHISVENYKVGDIPEMHLFLNDDSANLVSISSEWQICELENGICYELKIVDHPASEKENGWAFSVVFNRTAEGLIFQDQLKLTKVNAVSVDGDDYKWKGTLYWTINEIPVSVDEMDKPALDNHIAELELKIAELEKQLAEEESATLLEEQQNLQLSLEEACELELADCKSDEDPKSTTDDKTKSSGDGEESSNILTILGIITAVVIIGALLMMMLIRGRETEDMVDFTKQVPAMDNVANSMYGGTQQLFTQPVATAGPPLPVTGLPPGWTMEQWHYYGQQYLDSLQYQG